MKIPRLVLKLYSGDVIQHSPDKPHISNKDQVFRDFTYHFEQTKFIELSVFGWRVNKLFTDKKWNFDSANKVYFTPVKILNGTKSRI